MNNKAIFFLLLPLVLLPLYAFAAARTGGWSPITDIKDPHVIEIGEFAVSEYARETKSEFNFVTVVSGESQVVAGMNYKLVVTANHTGASKNYEAIVWEKPWLKSMNLTSFKPL
uniref:Cysteine proteinase inhibitor 5 n=2 Tax=Noccaea caerulescens TaxID=107243 RepID=A0A1J3JI51_NOCCA